MNNFSSNLNPDVVKTALDEVFFQAFDGSRNPGWIDVTNGSVFNQSRMDKGAEIMEVFKGVGYWDERAEEADVVSDTPRVGNQITFSPVNYAKRVDITKNFFDDEQFSLVQRMMRDFGLKASRTRERNGWDLFNNAFTTTTTADSVALISDSHATLNGDTVDNKLTAALSESSLNDAIIALSEQVDQAGVLMGNAPQTLLVPTELYKLACEITGAELRSTGASSDTSMTFTDYNVYSSKYGINVVTTPFLTDAAAWFLLAQNHGIYRWVRQDVQTALVDWRYTPNNNYVYKGEFREVVGAVDYAGIVGSNGTS